MFCAKVIRDGEEEEDYTIYCSISDVKNGISFNAEFSDSSVINKNKWESFLSAMENGSPAEIVYCNSNGEVSISTKNDFTTFTVGKYGAGGDGQISVTLANNVCLSEFKKMVAML